MNWLRISLFAQAVLALYFQLIQWFPLGRWNHQPEDLGGGPFSNLPLMTLAQRGQLSATAAVLVLAFLFPFFTFCLAYLLKVRWLIWLHLLPYGAWFAIELTWWVRYVVGYTDSQLERYNRVFGNATQVLPAFGRHMPPDAAHFVLHILLACVLLSLLLGLLRPAFAGFHRCRSLPPAFYYDDRPAFFEGRLEEIEAADFRRLYRCRKCGQHWRVDEWERYLIQVAVRIDDPTAWRMFDSSELENDLLVRSRGGLADAQCAWSDCPNKAVKGTALCPAHLRDAGVQR